MKKVSVLQIVPSLSQANGVASYSINYYKNLKNIKMDFIVSGLNTTSDYYDIIKNKGDKIIDLSKENSNGIFDYILKIKKFFKEHASEYDIVHCNVANSGVIFLYYAKKYGIKTRIIHSHGTSTSDSFFKKIRNNLILPFTKMFANKYFACSVAAGEAMFGNKEFIVINNAIDGKKFKFNEAYRKNIRNEFKIEDKIVIGNIGRLSSQKNQRFLIETFKLLKENRDKFALLIVGNGPLESELKRMVIDYELENNVIFTGSRSDVYKIYNGFDALLLPSLFEGLPVVGIEAQCNGLPCIFADTITSETQINSNVKFLPIDDALIWKEELDKMNFERTNNNSFIQSNYNIEKEAKKLDEIYHDLKVINK